MPNSATRAVIQPYGPNTNPFIAAHAASVVRIWQERESSLDIPGSWTFQLTGNTFYLEYDARRAGGWSPREIKS